MTANKEELLKDLTAFFTSCEGNTVPADKALEHCEGLVIFEHPIFSDDSGKQNEGDGYAAGNTMGLF